MIINVLYNVTVYEVGHLPSVGIPRLMYKIKDLCVFRSQFRIYSDELTETFIIKS